MVDTKTVGSSVPIETATNKSNKLECYKACDSNMSWVTCPSLTSFKVHQGIKSTMKTPLSKRMCHNE